MRFFAAFKYIKTGYLFNPVTSYMFDLNTTNHLGLSYSTDDKVIFLFQLFLSRVCEESRASRGQNFRRYKINILKKSCSNQVTDSLRIFPLNESVPTGKWLWSTLSALFRKGNVHQGSRRKIINKNETVFYYYFKGFFFDVGNNLHLKKKCSFHSILHPHPLNQPTIYPHFPSIFRMMSINPFSAA